MPSKQIWDRIETQGKSFAVYPAPVLEGIVREPLAITFNGPWEPDFSMVPETILSVPFIVNVAPVLWILGGTWTVPVMDSDLLESLNTLREGYRTLYPAYPWDGELVPLEVTANHPGPVSETFSRLLFFSGGVDSTWSALEADTEKTLLLSIRGHDISLDNDSAWDSVNRQFSAFADHYGFQRGTVRANVFRWLHYGHLHRRFPHLKPWYGNIQHGPGLAALGFPIAFERGMNEVLFSSSGKQVFPVISWGAHPLLEPCLRAGQIPLVSPGENLMWPEKIGQLVRFFREGRITERPFLRICLDEMSGAATANCGHCEKCIRGIFALLSQGEDPNAWGLPLASPHGSEARRLFESLPPPGRSRNSWREIRRMFARNAGKHPACLEDLFSWFLTLDLEALIDQGMGFWDVHPEKPSEEILR